MTTLLRQPFMHNGRVSIALVTLYLIINGIVAINAMLHHPMIGYDAVSHLRYVEALSHMRLPIPDDTKEFFVPPLPYVLPALAYRLGQMPCEAADIGATWGIADTIPPCVVVAGKVGQAQNVLLSLVLTWYLLKLCEIIRPHSHAFKMTVLTFMGMLPVYYKTFAYVRGEPFVLFCVVLVLYRVVAMLYALPVLAYKPWRSWRLGGSIPTLVRGGTLQLGVLLGLLVLSRQWGFFVFPPVALITVLAAYYWRGQGGMRMAQSMLVSFCIAMLIGGWFYVTLKMRYGSMTAFNRQGSASFALANQPPDFYTAMGDGQLFRTPLRPAFANQFWPIFYSEMWGDYWCYFSVTGCGPRRGFDDAISNKGHMQGYLGRVHAVALVPTLFFVAGFVIGTLYMLLSVVALFNRGNDVQGRYAEVATFALLGAVVVVSFMGYFWFLIKYPSLDTGDTIKATYMLHIFPALALLAGEFVYGVSRHYPRVYAMLIPVACAVFLHNLPAMLTRYVFLFGG